MLTCQNKFLVSFFFSLLVAAHISPTHCTYFLAEKALQRMADKNKSLECKGSHVPTGIKISQQSPSSLLTSLQDTFQQLWHLSQRGTRQKLIKSIISFQDYFPSRSTQKTKFTAFKRNNALQVLCENYVLPKSTSCSWAYLHIPSVRS